MSESAAGQWARFADPAAATFLLQIHFLLGVLQGLNLMGQCQAAWPVVAEARWEYLAKLKAICQTLNHEEAPAMVAQALQGFASLLEGLDQVEPDVELLTMLQEGLGGIH
jgi:hypothetical protein